MKHRGGTEDIIKNKELWNKKSGNVAEEKLYTLNRKASNSIESMGGGIYITSHHIFKLKIVALLLAL